MHIAVVDIGTNTVLLLVALLDDAGNTTAVAHEQRIPRLGKGVDANKHLADESMHRVIDVLKEYKAIMTRYSPERVIVCGTSAVRDAQNNAEFAARIRQETGFELEILSGDAEAEWTYRGAISGIPDLKKATVVDIGGGSTEIITGSRNTVTKKISLNIGSVRLTERFLSDDPPTSAQLEAAIERTEQEIEKLRDFDFARSTLVGVAGTATSLAILAQNLAQFDIRAVTNYRLTLDDVSRLFGSLRAMRAGDILRSSAVMEGRSDVITAGALILREIMSHLHFTEMIVSERGVRYGMAIREWERLKQI